MQMISITRLAAVGAALLGGCSDDGAADDLIDDLTESEVRGRVVDNRGQPVEGFTVQLYDLADNQHFVEGSDINAVSAYIDREAVLGSTNEITSAQTDADGTFTITDVSASAFLAVATKQACTAGFAGFDENTGVLNVNTLIKPAFDDGLTFTIPDFTIACATAPEVGPGGNSADAPAFDPPVADVMCDESSCVAAGGTCDADACVITCSAEACAQSGGTCTQGACLLPACNPDSCAGLGGACDGDICVLAACNADACAAAGGACEADACVTAACDDAACGATGGTCSGDGLACDIPACLAAEADCIAASGTCSADGSTCDIPACLAAQDDCTAAGGACSADGFVCELAACNSDEDCSAGQKGAYCTDAGDVALAACRPPVPGELVAPDVALGFTGLRVTDLAGNVLADAGSDSQVIATADLPGDRIVRIEADYDGDDTPGFLHVQSGSQLCPDMQPEVGAIPVRIVDGTIVSDQGEFLELVLTGGYQKMQLTTSEIAGEAGVDESFTIEIGDASACEPPATPFIVTLAWEAGPGEPADLDLGIWNAAGDLVFVGSKQAAWGQLAIDAKGPGPEVFEGVDAGQGPFTIKVTFFSGKPRDLVGKVRLQRSVAGEARDETFSFQVNKPKDVAEIGVFAAQ